MQDSRGFIWIGTKAGLNVFDGYTYTIYKQDSKDSLSLGGDYIKTVLEDKNQKIIVNTNNTVDVYDPETGNFSHLSSKSGETIIHNSTFAIHAFQTADKTIYFTSEDELYIYDPDNTIAVQLNVLKDIGFKGQNSEYVNYCEDQSGTLWIPFGKRIAGFNKDKEETYSISLQNSDVFQGERITNIYSHSPNKLGIFSTHHHYLYDIQNEFLEEKICYNLPTSISGYNELAVLFQDEHNIIWFTNLMESDILLYNPSMESFTNFPIKDENGRDLGYLRDLVQDQQGIWWLATPNDGLYFSYPDNLNTFRHILANPNNANSLNHNAVRAIAKSMEGELWFGTDGGGINIYDPYTSNFRFYSDDPEDTTSLASNSVLTICKDSYGRMLVGGYLTGLAVYNFAQDNFYNFLPDELNPQSLAHHDVRSIAEIDDGQFLIATNGGNGLELFDINSQQIIPFNFDPNVPGGDIVSHWLLTVYKDALGDVWVGGYGGLGKFDPHTGKSENFGANDEDPGTLSNSWVYCILRDSDGILWVGTSYGLNKFNDQTKTFTQYFENDGLPNNIICGLVEDADSNLWISTSKGISRLDKKTMTFSNYNVNDGLKVDQFNQGAYFKDDNGDIYFGGNGGVVYFNPSSFKKNTYKPPVYLTDFQISYTTVEIGKKDSPLKKHIAFTHEIKLNHRQNMITFNYVALNYVSPRKNQYEYMLEGLDEGWNKVDNRQEATYTNLTPGRYTFLVRATNNDGVLNEEGKSVDIVISPPWWKRWWFRIIIFLILLYFIIRILRIRESAAHRDKEILRRKIEAGEEEVQKQKDEIEAQKQILIKKEAAEKNSRWFNEAMAHLGAIVNKNTGNLYEMGRELISEIVSHVGANLGALYVINDEDKNKMFFELVGNYGADENKLKSRFDINDGYLAAVYQEKNVLSIDNLPDGYAIMKSGLGKTDLRHLLMIPLVQDENLNGIIELASLEKIPTFKVDLLEKLADNLAASIEILKVNERMKQMYEELNAHTEELNAQKEEMQQNLEEMTATQEEIERVRHNEQLKAKELKKQNKALQQLESENKDLRDQYDKLLKKYEKLTGNK